MSDDLLPVLTPKIEPERPIRAFIQDVISCLTEPKRFFTERYPEYSVTRAIAFGLILSWTASFLNWLTALVRHESYLDGFIKIRSQLETFPLWKALSPHLFSDSTSINSASTWIASFGGVVLNPFFTLIGFVFSATSLWIGGYILIPRSEDQDPIEFNSFLKLTAIAGTAPMLVGSILGFLPLATGTLIGLVYLLVIEVYALKVRFKISGLRAICVLFLPYLVLAFIGACFIGLIGGLIFSLVGSLFH